jgi:hypothetical protein
VRGKIYFVVTFVCRVICCRLKQVTVATERKIELLLQEKLERRGVSRRGQKQQVPPLRSLSLRSGRNDRVLYIS